MSFLNFTFFKNTNDFIIILSFQKCIVSTDCSMFSYFNSAFIKEMGASLTVHNDCKVKIHIAI